MFTGFTPLGDGVSADADMSAAGGGNAKQKDIAPRSYWWNYREFRLNPNQAYSMY